jgi:subtilisin family serine protease
MIKISDTIKTVVYAVLNELNEACDAKINVDTKNKIIKLTINNNPTTTISYEPFSKSDIKNKSIKFSEFLKKSCSKELIKKNSKKLYIACINDGKTISDVLYLGRSDMNDFTVKDTINKKCFTYYATDKANLKFKRLNKHILSCEKAEIIKIPEGEDVIEEQEKNIILKEGSIMGPTLPTLPTLPPNFNNFIRRIGAETSLSRTDNYPEDIYVFVFDSGIERHPLLNIKTELSRDFTVPELLNGKENPIFITGWSTDSTDPNRTILSGHGTHVAGTIGARDGRFAVAPGIPVVAYKVVPGNTITFERALTSIETFRDNNPRAKIIVNMSIAFRVGERPTFIFERTINRLASEKNITFIAAAGNDTIDSSIMSPARLGGILGNVITVASYNNVTNQFSQFSNFGVNVDINAPGERIFSTWLRNGYESIEGTSMATPVVAGAIVLMLSVEAKRNSNTLTPQQIKNRLREDAEDSFNDNSGANNISRNPRIVLPIEFIGNCPPLPPPPTNICTFPFPTTYPYSVCIGSYTKIVQNY